MNLVSSQSAVLGSVSSRLKILGLGSFNDSRLDLVRRILTRLAPEGRVILSCLAPGMGVNTAWCMGMFTFELLRRQDFVFIFVGADCLETKFSIIIF